MCWGELWVATTRATEIKADWPLHQERRLLREFQRLQLCHRSRISSYSWASDVLSSIRCRPVTGSSVSRELANRSSRSPHEFALLASSLRLRQEKRKMRTSQRSKPEILDNAPALCGVRKGNPGKVQRRQL